jgi:hypothetical protein
MVRYENGTAWADIIDILTMYPGGSAAGRVAAWGDHGGRMMTPADVTRLLSWPSNVRGPGDASPALLPFRRASGLRQPSTTARGSSPISSAIGILFLSPFSLQSFEEEAGQTNTSTVRAESSGLFLVHRVDAICRLSGS